MGRFIRLDWAIKKILREKANFSILEGFLSELLHFDLTIVEVLESESNKDDEGDKYNRVDLLVKDDQGRTVIIEVQNESELDYLQRLAYGTSKALTQFLQAGDPYSKIRKVYSVSIVYFDLGKGEDYLYHGCTRFTGLRKQDELQLTPVQQEMYKVKTPQELLPEYYLIKVPLFDDQVRDTLDEWIFFLKHEDIKDEFTAKGLHEAKQKLDVMKMDSASRANYQRYLENLSYQASMVESSYGRGLHEGKKKGIEEGRKKGIEEGRKKGIEEGRKEGMEEGLKQASIDIAKNLLDLLDDQTISTRTGLSIQEIQSLRQD